MSSMMWFRRSMFDGGGADGGVFVFHICRI